MRSTVRGARYFFFAGAFFFAGVAAFVAFRGRLFPNVPRVILPRRVRLSCLPITISLREKLYLKLARPTSKSYSLTESITCAA